MTRDDVVLIVGLSGGKDSAALCLWLEEQGIPFTCVFADTGWDHPDTYAYLEQLEQRWTVTRVRGELQMVGLIRSGEWQQGETAVQALRKALTSHELEEAA